MRLSKVLPLIKTLEKDCTLASNIDLVIDAWSFYQNTYRESGCQYILGGEYDRYAEHLRKILNNFLDLNVTCHVIFSGMSGALNDMDRRQEVHKQTIDKMNCFDFTKSEMLFVEPIFAKDVFKEVLNELGIRYAVCDGSNIVEMVNLARYYGCPLVTRNVEYSLFGVPCISPKSLTFLAKSIACKIYEPDVCQKRIGLAYHKLAMFMVLIDDQKDYLQDLERLITFHGNNVIDRVHHYIYRQTIDMVLSDFRLEMASSRYEKLLNDFNMVKAFMCHSKPSLMQKYFQNGHTESGDWFAIGVITDRIANCYMGLKKSGVFSGSWLICDNNKNDPMLLSMNIVRLAFELLNNFRGAKIAFLGRVGTQSKVWDICDSIGFTRAEGTVGEVFKNGWSTEELPDYFSYFFQVELPGLNFDALKLIPADCRLLMMALVYYSSKIDGDKLALVYSVLLSYTMLGPVARTTGLLRHSNFTLMKNDIVDNYAKTTNGLLKSDCFVAARAMVNYFYCNDVAKKFDREILHMFAEFQHCLQQLNYLNRLCGERMQRTMYHRCYNATFIYNMYLELRDSTGPIALATIEMILRKSPSVLQYFNNLVNVFERVKESLSRTSLTNQVQTVKGCAPRSQSNPKQCGEGNSRGNHESCTIPEAASEGLLGGDELRSTCAADFVVSGSSSAVGQGVSSAPAMLSGAQSKKRARENQQYLESNSQKTRMDSDDSTGSVSASKKPKTVTSISHSEAPNVCRMAIIADGDSWRLTPETASSVLLEIFDLVVTTPVLPQMDALGCISGALQFACDGDIDVQWLCALNGRTVGGVKLRVVNAKDLPKPVKLAWETRLNYIKDISRVLALMQRYNPNLRTSEWKLVDTQENETQGSVRRIVLVDQDSAHYIKERGYSLRVGLERSYFKVLEEPASNAASVPDSSATNVPAASDAGPIEGPVLQTPVLEPEMDIANVKVESISGESEEAVTLHSPLPWVSPKIEDSVPLDVFNGLELATSPATEEEMVASEKDHQLVVPTMT